MRILYSFAGHPPSHSGIAPFFFFFATRRLGTSSHACSYLFAYESRPQKRTFEPRVSRQRRAPRPAGACPALPRASRTCRRGARQMARSASSVAAAEADRPGAHSLTSSRRHNASNHARTDAGHTPDQRGTAYVASAIWKPISFQLFTSATFREVGSSKERKTRRFIHAPTLAMTRCLRSPSTSRGDVCPA